MNSTLTHGRHRPEGTPSFARERERLRALIYNHNHPLTGRDGVADAQRRETARDKRDLYEGHAERVLTRYIASVFTTSQVRESLVRVADTSVNLMRRIPDRVAMLYAEPPVRHAGPNVIPVAALDAFVTGGFDAFMADIQRRVIAHGVVAVEPVFVKGRVRLYVHDPDALYVLTDPMGDIEAVCYPIRNPESAGGASAGGRAEDLYMLWTAERQAVLNRDLADVSDRYAGWLTREDGANPYGVVPFAFFPAEPGTVTGDPLAAMHTSDSLMLGTLIVMLYATELNHQIKAGSFRQIVVTGQMQAEDMARVLRDSQAIFVAEAGAQVSVLDSTANIEGMRRAIESKIEDVCAAYGLSLAEFRRTAQVASGVALSLERQGVVDFNRRMRAPFARGEAALWAILTAMVKAHGLTPDEAPWPDGPFTVTYREPVPVASEAERFALFKDQLGLGLVKASSFWGSLDDATALARAEEIAAFNRRFLALQGGGV